MSCIKVINDHEFNEEPKILNNPRFRFAARGIIFNDKNKVAVLNKQNKNEFKLIGGGIEGEESPEEAFLREALEESGCKVMIDELLGTIKEERTQHNFVQVSYVYKAHVVEYMKHLNLTEKEKTEGSRLLWLDLDEAIKVIKECENNLKASIYEDVYATKFIVRRDYYILKYYMEGGMNERNNLIDYTSKLNDHEDYLKILDILEKKTDYIEIVYENEITDKFKDDIIFKEHTTNWWSEESYPGGNLYRIKVSKELFNYLRKYETFCKYIYGGETRFGIASDKNVVTDFGTSDIAFFDKEGKILLQTVTHEGFIDIDKDIIK